MGCQLRCQILMSSGNTPTNLIRSFSLGKTQAYQLELQSKAQAWRDIPAAASSSQTSSVGDSGSNNNRSLASSLQCPYKQWDCAFGRLTKPLSHTPSCKWWFHVTQVQWWPFQLMGLTSFFQSASLIAWAHNWWLGWSWISSVFFCQFCDVAKVVMIHRNI